uniref:Uncharacterized protein n=1 Tax=Molossus molossus TaxID=27622 RepID=A0A7J8HBI8_MOLMO|nr:hypothetical protein HJG59_011101 [Molossus molossus]
MAAEAGCAPADGDLMQQEAQQDTFTLLGGKVAYIPVVQGCCGISQCIGSHPRLQHRCLCAAEAAAPLVLVQRRADNEQASGEQRCLCPQVRRGTEFPCAPDGLAQPCCRAPELVTVSTTMWSGSCRMPSSPYCSFRCCHV